MSMPMPSSASFSTSTSTPKARENRRFAPLDPGARHGQDLPRLKGIVFDVDGTLWYDFLFGWGWKEIMMLMLTFFSCFKSAAELHV